MIRDAKPQIFGTGLVALDVVVPDTNQPAQSWAGGTCCNVLTILSGLGWASYPIARLKDDAASKQIRKDLNTWNVNLDFISCCEPASTPIIIQKNSISQNGKPTHKFFLVCPKCGKWLPSYKPITLDAVSKVGPRITGNDVFFMDRLSSASLKLARITSDRGGIVFYEPSSVTNIKYFKEALKIAHIVKYTSQRIPHTPEGLCRDSDAAHLEICTHGERGLEWRFKNNHRWGKWNFLSAYKTDKVLDTCGSGDWCTAGIITNICQHGSLYLKNLTQQAYEDAFIFSQKMAAWNCNFLGARGGMYFSKKDDFKNLMSDIMANHQPKRYKRRPSSRTDTEVKCPICNSSF